MKRTALAALLALALLSPAHGQPAPSIGMYLYQHGYVTTIYRHNIGNGWQDAPPGHFNPSAALSPDRYFDGHQEPGGSLGGERCVGSGGVGVLVREGAPLGCIARGLGFPDSYYLTNLDSGDLMYLAAPGGGVACDYLRTLYPCASSNPNPEPTPAPTVAPVTCRCIGPGDLREPAGCVPPIHTVVQCAPTPEPTPEPTPTPAPQPPPCPVGCTDVTGEDSTVRTCRCPASCPPATVCPPVATVSCANLLTPRGAQTLRVAEQWTAVDQRKAWLRALRNEVAAMRCVKP